MIAVLDGCARQWNVYWFAELAVRPARMKTRVAFVLILISLRTIPSTAQVQYRDLETGNLRIRSIVLLPIRVSLTKKSVKNAEPMPQEASDAELSLALEVEAALRDLNYQVDTRSLSRKTLEKDSKLASAVDDVQKRFDSLLPQLRGDQNGIRSGRFSLDNESTGLPLVHKPDALLFVRCYGQLLTEAKRALTVPPITKADFMKMDLALADASTGRILYLAQGDITPILFHYADGVATGIAKALAAFPRSPTPPGPVEGFLASSDSPVTNLPESDSNLKVRRISLSQTAMKYQLTRRVDPAYPGIATANGIEGDVVIHAVIDHNGRVAEMSVVSGPIQLISAATSAVKQWQYHPLVVDGEPVEIKTRIVLSFRLRS